MRQVRLTRKGYEALSAELDELVNVRRPQVIADIAQAREYGDISENAEYETAKRDQGVIEGRIRELESLLSSAEILDPPSDVTEGVLGARVKVENLDGGRKLQFVLVTEQEAFLEEEFLSVESPLGKALLGSKAGEIVTFEAPAGTRRFKVLELCAAGKAKVG